MPRLLQVTCGSAVKLQHAKTNYVLHSHDVAYGYGRGSGQRSVTATTEQDNANALWIVRGGETPCVQGTPVNMTDRIRLQHLPSRKWLHSHLYQSPLSQAQEVRGVLR